MKIIDEFVKLFRGFEKAHGQHELFSKPDESGKLKGRASTKAGSAGPVQYETHLKGEGVSLGLIPLLQDDTCWFGAIDIDIKGEPHLTEPIEELEGRIRKLELPLVVCRSKSGGAHLYLFATSPIPAKQVQSKLSEFSAALGYGGAEVNPKQVMRANEQDYGNWINIPYYGVLSKKGTERYCIRNGKPIKKLEEFLKYGEMMRVSPDALSEVKLKMSEMFADGPPCLQYLATFGLQEGGRNNALTNIAIYYKRKNPDDWQDQVMKFNFANIKPSLDISEVNQILKHISRKEYFYTCKNPPMVNHCDKKQCAKRDFGLTVGGDTGELFPIDNLTKCVSKDSVRWYAEHQGLRVEVTTEELLNQQALQRIYLDKHNIVIIPGKQQQHLLRLRELMVTCDIVQDPEDASRQGQFEKLVDNFFTGSRPARNRDELIKGNSFIEDGRIFFRSEDLFDYLKVRRFMHTPHEVWQWLKELGAKDHQMRVKGKMLRVWSLPEPQKFDSSPIDLPQEVVEEEL